MGGQSKDRAKTTPALMCIKILLHIFNLIYLLIGISVLAIGIWIQVELKNYMQLTDLYYDNAAYIMIGVGALILLIAVSGFVCTAKDKIALLYMYAILISLIAILQIAAGVAGAVFSKKIDYMFESGLMNSIIHHDSNMDAWNKVQQVLNCCGVDEPNDWKNATLGNLKQLPNSCYPNNKQPSVNPAPSNASIPVSTATTTLASTTAIAPSNATGNGTAPDRRRRDVSDAPEKNFEQGCHSKIVDKAKKYMGIIVGVCVGFVVLQIIGAILACCLAKKTSKNNYEQIY